MYQQATMQQPGQIPNSSSSITLEMRQRYFELPPFKPTILTYIFASFGVLAALTALLGRSFFPIVILLFTFRFIWKVIRWFMYTLRPTITDQQYDQWIRSHQDMAYSEGLEKFREALNASRMDRAPVIIQGFVYRNDRDAAIYNGTIRHKRGDDNRARSSIARFIIMFIAEHEICVYVRDINALSTYCYNKADSYYYHDIVGVGTTAKGHSLRNFQEGNSSEVIEKDESLDLFRLHHFELKISNGDTIGVTVYDNNNEIDKIVSNLRKLLGEKKYGPGHGYRPQGFPGTSSASGAFGSSTTGPTPYGGYANHPTGPNPYNGYTNHPTGPTPYNGYANHPTSPYGGYSGSLNIPGDGGNEGNSNTHNG